MFTPENITDLKPNEVFVFGSNEAGVHGAGAARTAVQKFGAVWKCGVGHYGQTYAIPTKDFNIEVLPLDSIKEYVDEFLIYVENNPELTFLVTKIGTGFSGYLNSDIAPMFKVVPLNCILPKEFHS